MTPDPVADVHRLLAERGATVATAESLTGGRLAALLTGVPGASATYVGGAVTYATALKVSMLGVPETLVAEHGVVSAECARAMAEGMRRVAGATYALATTGVAGPDLQEGKPAGTVYVALAGPAGSEVLELELTGDRWAVQDATCLRCVELLRSVLVREETTLG
ncbi:PncC family amidohydrolase [Nocardioides ginsengisegetis]|uniref:PncC family amidohydrolase n=1 Tax=Nocardioides ginsengisegetis TaxID=661491 RepID=A0A7W3P904_9ACTN|nr:PncC family amidohydrolase [Nocardioides ginsengisegetis]